VTNIIIVQINIFPEKKFINDGTVAVIVSVALFMIPARDLDPPESIPNPVADTGMTKVTDPRPAPITNGNHQDDDYDHQSTPMLQHNEHSGKILKYENLLSSFTFITA
jgi:hypothetical protein